MSARVRIRKAGPRDLSVLVRHRRAMFQAIRPYSTIALDRADSIYRPWLRKKLRSGEAVAFIAEDSDSVPVGSGAVFIRYVDPCPLRQEGVPHIISMFTEAGCRGQGVATRIVNELAGWCRHQGFTQVSLSPAPRARSLYRRIGFERDWEMSMSLTEGTGSSRGGRR